MSEDQFTKLFKYMQQEFAKVQHRLGSFEERTRQNFDRVFGLLDAHAKTIETLEQERIFSNHQLDIHENWIERAAPVIKVGYKR